MKLVAVLLLACCLAGGYCAHAEFHAQRQLLKRAKASTSTSAKSDTPEGRASTTATARSTGGEAEAVASATAEAFTAVSNKLVEYFEYAFNNLDGKQDDQTTDEYCENAFSILETQLEAAGEVTATAYSEAIATVEVSGEGEACASGDAAAQSQASGYAKVVAEAIAEASNDVSEAKAEAVVEAVVEVIAAAFASAFAAACVSGEGSALAMQTSLAEAISKPLASATVLAVAEVDCSKTAGFSEVDASAEGSAAEETTAESEGTTEITGEGTAESGGEAEAFTATLERCSGKYYLCCRESGNTCTCSLTSRSKRCDAVRVKYDQGEYWSDDDNEVYCKCPTRHTHTTRLPVV